MALAGRIAPPLALMALIWVLSAQPDLNSGLGWVDLVGRKLVHAVEFGVLFVLWHRALRWRHPSIAAAITIAWAVIDELHQTQVHGRVGSPADVAIDASGVFFAWALCTYVASRRRDAAT